MTAKDANIVARALNASLIILVLPFDIFVCRMTQSFLPAPIRRIDGVRQIWPWPHRGNLGIATLVNLTARAFCLRQPFALPGEPPSIDVAGVRLNRRLKPSWVKRPSGGGIQVVRDADRVVHYCLVCVGFLIGLDATHGLNEVTRLSARMSRFGVDRFARQTGPAPNVPFDARLRLAQSLLRGNGVGRDGRVPRSYIVRNPASSAL